MVFFRYVTCIVAAFAVIAYTVHLERNTPIVYRVKTMLGLDTSALEASLRGEQEPGVIEVAIASVTGGNGLPSLSELLSTPATVAPPADLPPALVGWMREDMPMDAAEIAKFENSFASRRGAGASELDMLLDGSIDRAGMGVAGAFYYREDMRMLITISGLPEALGRAAKEILTANHLAALENNSDPKRVLDLNGELVPVRRDRGGFGSVSVMAGEDILVQLRGNVPAAIMQEYLEQVSQLKPISAMAAVGGAMPDYERLMPGNASAAIPSTE